MYLRETLYDRKKVNKIIIITSAFFISIPSFALLVIANSAKIKINGRTVVNNVFLILNNPTVIPIQTSEITDEIIIEGEYNGCTTKPSVTLNFTTLIRNGLLMEVTI